RQSHVLLRASATLIHERHWFGASHIPFIEPLDAKTGVLNQLVNRAVQVTAPGQMLPCWGEIIFLDSERPEYPGWWPNLRRVLRLGGLRVADNATSHPEQMAPFVALVHADAEFSTSLVPVGNGEFLAVRSPK